MIGCQYGSASSVKGPGRIFINKDIEYAFIYVKIYNHEKTKKKTDI